jgi:DivIVA domain-containing protein
MNAMPDSSVGFRRTRWRTGYSAKEVDAFVAEVEIAMFSPEPRMSASDLAWRRFTQVRHRAGYDMDDVDRYLKQAKHLLSEAERRQEPHPFGRDLSA